MTDSSKQPASESSPDAAAAQADSGTEGTAEVSLVKPEVSPAEASSSASQEQDVSPEAQVDQPASEAGIAEAGGEATVNSVDQTANVEDQPSSDSSAAVASTASHATPPPSDPPVPPAPQATTPGYTEPAPGAHRPRGSRRRLMIVLGVFGVLLLVVGGVLAYVFIQDSSDSAHKAGNCIEQEGSRAKSVDCDNKNAFRIIKRLNHTQSDKGCPASETELYFVNETKDYVLCLKKNTAEN